MSTIASHLLSNISETIRDKARLGFKGPPIGNGLLAVKRSRGRWRHVTPKGQTPDCNTLRAQYLENSWRWHLATIIVNYEIVCSKAVLSAILVFDCLASF